MTRPASTRSTALAAMILAAGLALSGCASEPAPAPASPSASPPASTEPASSPEDSDGEIAAVLVRADAVEYLDGSGEPVDDARDAYTEPVDAVLARLTEMLGDPAAETYESNFTQGSGTRYRWSGLTLDAFPAEMVEGVPDAPLWGVALESASAGELRLVTVDGLSVGDPAPADLETTACNSRMAEIVGAVGVEVDGDPSVVSVRAPVYTDACE